MQPQGPYGPSNGNAQNGPQPYLNPNQPGPMPGAPGQTIMPGQQYPAAPGQAPPPGQPYPAQAPNQPALPGQPAMPQYQMPPARGRNQPNDLPPPPEAPTTPYDFFMQPKPATPMHPLPVNGRHFGNYPGKPVTSSKTKFLILVAAGALGLITILSLIIALSPKDPAPNQFFGLAQTQQEVVRLCTQGSSKAKYRSTRYFAVTCSTGITTSQKELLAYMGKVGYQYDSKLLGGKADSQADSKLKSAASSSTYDDVFRDIMEAKLTAYDRALTSQLGVTTGANGRELLTKNQRAAELLLLMVKDDSDKTEAPTES